MSRVPSEPQSMDVYSLGKRYCPLFPFHFLYYLRFSTKLVDFGYFCFFYHIVLRYFSVALPFPPLAIAVPLLPMEGAEGVQQTECGKHVFDRVLFQAAPALPPHCTALALWLVVFFYFIFSAFHDKPNTLCRKAVGVLCLIWQYECKIKTI